MNPVPGPATLAPAYTGPLAIEPSLRGVHRCEDFLRVIVANPDTDEPRLVLADWLIDQGLEDRAELIRVQSSMYRLQESGRADGQAYRRLERRAATLLEQHPEWKPASVLACCTFHRGLLEQARIRDVAGFLEAAPALLRQTTLQVIDLDDRQQLGRLFTLPEFAQVYSLDAMGAKVQGEEVALLAASPLTGLRTLKLSGCNVGVRGARALAGLPALRSLRYLALGDTSIGEEGMRALLAASWPALAYLDLAFQAGSLEGLRWLVGALPEQLEWLYLEEELGNAVAETVAASERLGRLRALELWSSGLDAEGARTLAESPHLAGLELLNLRRNRLGPEGIRFLLRSPRLSRLAELHLDYCELDDGAARVLAEEPGSARLRFLRLEHNRLTDAGALALAQSPHLSELTWLDLRSNRLGDRGAQALLGSRQLSKLTDLQLTGNRLKAAGLRALADSPHRG